MDDLESNIIRFSNAQYALEWFESHDWQGDYSWHRKEQREFIKMGIDILEGRIHK